MNTDRSAVRTTREEGGQRSIPHFWGPPCIPQSWNPNQWLYLVIKSVSSRVCGRQQRVRGWTLFHMCRDFPVFFEGSLLFWASKGGVLEHVVSALWNSGWLQISDADKKAALVWSRRGCPSHSLITWWHWSLLAVFCRSFPPTPRAQLIQSLDALRSQVEDLRWNRSLKFGIGGNRIPTQMESVICHRKNGRRPSSCM